MKKMGANLFALVDAGFNDLARPVIPTWFRPGSTGAYRARLAVPNLPALAGVLLAAQAACGPTTTPPLGLDLTNGVWLRAGR